MTASGDPLLAGRGGKDAGGRPSVGAAVLRLYRGDPVWRGAVDMAAIGSLLLVLIWGYPDLLKPLERLFPARETTPPPAQVGANFSPPVDSAANRKPAPPSFPKPFSPGAAVDRRWLGEVSSEDRAALEKAADAVGTDNAKAREFLGGLVGRGEANAQYLMGAVAAGEALAGPVKGSLGPAAEWYAKAGLQGHPAAQYQLGQIHRLLGVDGRVDYAEAVRWYSMAAANPLEATGFPEDALARLYLDGLYFPKDAFKAREWFEAAAGKGNPLSARTLGSMFYNGQLGARDMEKARAWTEKAAESGDAAGQLNLGLFYQRGRMGGSPDYAQFLKWAGLAADQGLVDAMIELGSFYREGRPGFEPDQRLAAKYFRLAALKKDPKGQYMLAQMFQQGLGLPQDDIQAYVYFSLAYKSGGFAPAYAALSALAGKMSAGQLAYAESMAKALTPAAAGAP